MLVDVLWAKIVVLQNYESDLYPSWKQKHLVKAFDAPRHLVVQYVEMLQIHYISLPCYGSESEVRKKNSLGNFIKDY